MSESTIAPMYDDLADVFWRLGIMQSPSALQGLLAGQIAAGATLTAEQWLAEAREYLDPIGEIDGEDRYLLLDLLSTTSSQVSGGEFKLELLLPDDSVDMSQRVESLGQWCQSFLAGFAKAGKAVQVRTGKQQYSAQLSEMLSDIAAISQIGLGEDDADFERREQDFFEIHEYLRIATLNIYYECNPAAAAPLGATESLYSGGRAKTSDSTSPMTSPADLFANKTLH